LSVGSTTIPNVALSGVFQLEVNGTAITRTVRTLDIDPTTGAVRGLKDGEIAPGTVRILAAGTVKLAAFELTGRFSFALSSTSMSVEVSAAVKLGPLGTGMASGSLTIDSAGVLGALTIVGDAGVGASLGLSINGSLRLEVNTASVARTVTLASGSVLVAPGFLLRMSGNLVLAGVLDSSGDLELSYDTATRTFTVVGTLRVVLAGGLLDGNLSVLGILNSAGLVLMADVSIKSSVLGIFSLDAAGKLYVNTRKSGYTHPVTGVVLGASSVFLQVKGQATLMNVLSLDVDARVQVGGTFARPASAVTGSVATSAALRRGEWGIALSTRMSFFGIGSVDAAVWLQSNGSFGVGASGSVRIGGGDIFAEGRLTAVICYDSVTDFFALTGSILGRVNIGLFGLNASAQLNYDSASGALSVTGSISGSYQVLEFGWVPREVPIQELVVRWPPWNSYWTTRWMTVYELQANWVTKNWALSNTWSLGRLARPVKGVGSGTQLIETLRNSAGNNLEDGDSVGASGELVIDMTRSGSTQQDYAVRLAQNQLPTTGGGQSLEVVHQGRVLVFHGVRTIRVKGANEAASVDIGNGITAQVLVNDTGGDNKYTVSGGSASLMNEIILGGGNDTVNTTSAPASARFTIRAGNGSNLIEAGAANDIIHGGSGIDRISAGAGDDTVNTGTGTSYVTLDSGRTELATDGKVARLLTAGSGAGNDTLIGSASGTVYVLGGGGNDTITTGSGADVVVGDEGSLTFGTDGALTSVVSRASDSAGADLVDAGTGTNLVIGGSGADRMTIGVGSSLMLGGNGTVTVSPSGRVVSGLTAGGAVELVCSTGTILADETLVAGTLSISSAASLVVNSLSTSDSASPIALSSTAGDVTVNTTSGAAGLLSISAFGAITASQIQPGIVITRAQSLGSTVTLSGPGDLSVEFAASKARTAAMKTGWDIAITSGGNLRIGLIQSHGAAVTLFASGSIEEAGDDAAADLVAKTASLSAGSGIGAVAPIETQLSVLSAVSTAGDINLANSGALSVNVAKTQAATGGNIRLSTESGTLTATEVTASGKGALIALATKGSGDVLVGTVTANEGKIEVSSTGFIEAIAAKPDGEYHLIAGSVKLSAAAVGTKGAVKTLELAGSMKAVVGLPDLRSYLGTGWTERVWNNISGTSDTARLEALNSAAASRPAGDALRLRQTDLSTPVTSVANNFGVIASGWMITTAAGDYRFWAAADDVAQLWIYDASGKALGGGPVVTSPFVTAGTWSNAPKSAAVRLEADTFYRFEVRYVEVSGGEYFRVGYATGTNPTTPQAIVGSTTPLTAGASTPISIVPDLTGSVVTVKLNAGTGSTLDVGRPGMLDKAWTIGSSASPNLTLQGDRTDTVSLIGTFSNIQAFLQTEGNVRYSVLADSILKISVATASLPMTTNGTSFTTKVFLVDLPVSGLPTLTRSSGANSGTLTQGVLDEVLGKSRNRALNPLKLVLTTSGMDSIFF
jgi:hypothetical protein